MDRQTVDLGFVVRRSLDDRFTMDSAGGRLTLQRAIYLLHACGVRMGYSFTWYLRGPYCPVLAAQGFELRHIYGCIPRERVEFASPLAQASFKKFLGLVRGKSADELEILALLHYLRANRPDLDADGVKGEVGNRGGRSFAAGQVARMWDELAGFGLVA